MGDLSVSRRQISLDFLGKPRINGVKEAKKATLM